MHTAKELVPAEQLVEEEVLTLWYDEGTNSWTDCNSLVVLDLFRYVSPGYFEIFRHGQSNMVVPRRDKPGEVAILFGEDRDEEDFKVYI